MYLYLADIVDAIVGDILKFIKFIKSLGDLAAREHKLVKCNRSAPSYASDP